MKKKLLLMTMALACAFSALAEFRWGPTVGINVSTYKFKQKLIGVSSSVGPNVGVIGEMMFPGIGFGIDFGLQYQMRGAKMDFGSKEVWAVDGYGNEQVWIHTIQIPVNLRYKYTNLNGLEDIVAPLAFAGPVFSITAGHNKMDCLEYPNGCFGVQVGLGAELFRHWQVTGAYYWGMAYELRTVKLDNFSARPRGWQVNVTYLF